MKKLTDLFDKLIELTKNKKIEWYYQIHRNEYNSKIIHYSFRTIIENICIYLYKSIIYFDEKFAIPSVDTYYIEVLDKHKINKIQYHVYIHDGDNRIEEDIDEEYFNCILAYTLTKNNKDFEDYNKSEQIKTNILKKLNNKLNKIEMD